MIILGAPGRPVVDGLQGLMKSSFKMQMHIDNLFTA